MRSGMVGPAWSKSLRVVTSGPVRVIEQIKAGFHKTLRQMAARLAMKQRQRV
jgi:hypothetical protein